MSSTMWVALLIVTLVSAARAQSVDVTILSSATATVRILNNTNSGLDVYLTRNGLTKVAVNIGLNAGNAQTVTQNSSLVNIIFDSGAILELRVEEITGKWRGHLINFSWTAPSAAAVFKDCVNFGQYHWYGGPQQKRQLWPIEKLVFSEYSYVTKESDNCGVAEPYWLNSDGIFYYVDKTAPLFIDQNNAVTNATCFIAQIEAPYSSKREVNTLIYTMGIFEDVRKAHEFVVDKYLHKPVGIPDERMITHPIWSTWAKYKTAINHDVVLQFADDITNNGFNNSQLEIDDLWETCYGSQTVDEARFPNMTNTVASLKAKGFRVTIWTHPFVNKNCEPWYTTAQNNGYLVTTENGTVETSWWNDNGTTAAYIDFTKTTASEWYLNRLVTLKNTYGLDGFKFDAGESSWSPQIPVLNGDIYDQPGLITEKYVRAVAQFGSIVEVRAGHGTQDLPVFIRIIDKDTYWTFENGLPTLITTLLQMNMNGYPLVLPDMIGGNGYNGTLPSKELFIRWLQANTFMPSLQFSYVPWDFDNETVTISQKFVDLHANYSSQIIAACKQATKTGSPVNPPLWWIAPNDTTAHGIWDEFMLGEDIIAAPVVTEGATMRDIYLPNGTWYEFGNSSNVHVGPLWLRNFSAPLDTLPYFVRGNGTTNDANIPYVSVILVLFSAIMYFVKEF